MSAPEWSWWQPNLRVDEVFSEESLSEYTYPSKYEVQSEKLCLCPFQSTQKNIVGSLA